MAFPFGFVLAGLRLVHGLTSPADALRPVVVVLVLLIPARALAERDFQAIPLSPPYVAEPFGVPAFFAHQGPNNAQLVTPGTKHLEIDKSTQRLRAYEEDGHLALEALVSTGKPGVDEHGRQRYETASGLHRVAEVRPFKRWSKDPTVTMLNWIGLVPGVEKGIHSLQPIGEFAHYEKLLGQAASHGCIRLSREDSRRLVDWIGEDWRRYPLIVYIYDRSAHRITPLEEPRYLLLLVLQGGTYRYDAFSSERLPSLRKDESAQGVAMTPGSFVLYKKEADGWRTVRSSLPQSDR